MNRLIPLVASVALCTVACGDNQDPAGADALLERIQQENYRSFARAPGFETQQPSNTAHSNFVDIYINDVVVQALASGEPMAQLPVGSLIVKDGFTDDGELDLIAIMDKTGEGESGWFWVETTDPSSPGAKFAGEPGICLDCHDAGKDYVRSFTFP